MFSKILIANRGEIACRVIKTAKKLGIKTVAIYSEADDGALHQQMADEAVAIGPGPATESYLDIDKIVAAAKKTGAEAVHPGYGFLSENAKFVKALNKAGITFIGPDAAAIAAMGDKIQSKKLAKKARVAIVPGHLEAVEDADQAAKVAAKIGFPVMLKASAGGGGKGMRIAYNAREVREGLKSAANEARSAFGDPRVFIEKFIEEPRHIEIQVLGDKHGNYVHLAERECSIQRRHQKVIEEAPSPFLDAATRQAMGEQAIALAAAVGYHTAGTVEFIVDRDRIFYFLEMNTRLQVEHPVTEMITGIDLVEQMIRIAAGERLTLRQVDITLNGWAFEGRIYAEDPYRGFLPSTGRIRRLRMPPTGLHVRVDTGVVEGSEISLYYDPMIAKLCAHGDTREQALERMAAALDGTVIEGISHNVNFLSAVIGHARFRAGRLSTNFIAEAFADGFQGASTTQKMRDRLIAVATFVHHGNRAIEQTISGQIPDHEVRTERRLVATLTDVACEVLTDGPHAGRMELSIDGRELAVESGWRPGATLFEGLVDEKPMTAQVRRLADGYRLSHAGAEVDIAVRRPRAAALAGLMPVKPAPDLSKFLVCPMPGLVVAINAAVGDEVKAGQPLAVVEAMKMENILRAETDGVVAKVNAKPGDSLAVDDVIMEFA